MNSAAVHAQGGAVQPRNKCCVRFGRTRLKLHIRDDWIASRGLRDATRPRFVGGSIMSAKDRLYYAMRAEAERLHAKNAATPQAQAIHARIAAEYEAIAKGEQPPPRPIMR